MELDFILAKSKMKWNQNGDYDDPRDVFRAKNKTKQDVVEKIKWSLCDCSDTQIVFKSPSEIKLCFSKV